MIVDVGHTKARFPKSFILVLGEKSVASLLPSTLISQAESLLESHKIQDAVNLADQQYKKIYSSMSGDEDQVCSFRLVVVQHALMCSISKAEELRYVYQRIGIQCFAETMFEDAGKNLYKGEVDPRVIASYFPDLCGSLLSDDDTMNVYAGVQERMPREASVDDISECLQSVLFPLAPPHFVMYHISCHSATFRFGSSLRDWLSIDLSSLPLFHPHTYMHCHCHCTYALVKTGLILSCDEPSQELFSTSPA
jgi:hypothetical protein